MVGKTSPKRTNKCARWISATAAAKGASSLRKSQRMAVVLRCYEHLSYEEIAAVLGLSVSAIKSLLFQARTSLREALSGYLEL